MTNVTIELSKNNYDSLIFSDALPKPGGFTIRPKEKEHTQIFKLMKGTSQPTEKEYSIEIYISDKELNQIRNLNTIDKKVGINGFENVSIKASPSFSELIKKQN